MTTRGLLIIEAAHVASARALATAEPFALTEEALEALFVPAGSPSGEAPATHWWASGEFTAPQWEAIQQLAAVLPWAVCQAYDLRNDPGFPQREMLALGLLPLKREVGV